ncbi:MAG: hypothetical protein WA131_04865 [Desulfitobacteriaceae bacterium]
MSKVKAIVLEKTSGFYLVLDSDGTFRRVRSRFKAEVGEEIEVVSGTTGISDLLDFSDKRKSVLRVLLSVAAILLLTIGSTLAWSSWQAPVAVGLLSVDINPSLEIALDKGARIVSAKAKNEDALKLLQGVNLKGQTLTIALNRLVSRAVELHFLNEERKWIVLGLSEGSAGKTSKPSDFAGVDSQTLQSGLNEVAATKGLDLQVVMFKLTSQEGLEAQKAGLSLGEYALWQTAEKAGHSVPPQTLKNTTERSNLLEVPAVQAELKHNQNTIDKEDPVEQPNQDMKTAPDHGLGGIKARTPSDEKSEERKLSKQKSSTDSFRVVKPSNASVKGKIDSPDQMKSVPEIEEEHSGYTKKTSSLISRRNKLLGSHGIND